MLEHHATVLVNLVHYTRCSQVAGQVGTNSTHGPGIHVIFTAYRWFRIEWELSLSASVDPAELHVCGDQEEPCAEIGHLTAALFFYAALLATLGLLPRKRRFSLTLPRFQYQLAAE